MTVNEYTFAQYARELDRVTNGSGWDVEFCVSSTWQRGAEKLTRTTPSGQHTSYVEYESFEKWKARKEQQ